jgi:hypothetical protein
MMLNSNHPGVSVEEIKNEQLALRCRRTFWRPSTQHEELAAVRKYDPKGVWTS